MIKKLTSKEINSVKQTIEKEINASEIATKLVVSKYKNIVIVSFISFIAGVIIGLIF